MSRLVCLGILVKDLVFRVPHIPAKPQKLTCTSLQERFGGMAATAAAAAAALGGDVEFWGRVGDDETGRQAQQALLERGVKTQLQVTPGSRSPVSAVLVDDAGERMLAVYTGELDPSPQGLPLHALAGCGAVHADFRWPQGAKALFQAARALNIPCVLDADAGNPQAVLELAKMAQHVIFSERGLFEQTGDMPVEQALRHMAQHTDAVLGVTLGPQGSVFLQHGQIHRFSAVAVLAVDTNGAGDVFHGAYALELARGKSWQQAASHASLAASLKCTREHNWATLPSHDEVLAFSKSLTAH